ncbi:DNA primase family protein [Bradyrhizobium japonicum]|uniref:DNA primase family protein n=1 Tax=Bradyrhizobium japonicum TaxID=375 RepID=UPI0018AD3156|nr:phage/plasmid primase, P4 family [Bradyrhizobium japonicum]MCP1738201.1 putative DNA primase/helicase [Bradyrhizobium japonicum]MCP1855985.1 putative DNA primase/helicase [Bradyrhizobium japonicum]MCP1897200.1 putative DNA primase/helicase [Bradyrhizobium japonicum]MCW2330752.1 putative DNA primase/helicase [Bradyrhizobium japonicum]WLB96031.1 phage/plasmid primase, P4 family [Bradyrhizobium japonicum USDA 123]
MNKHVRPALGDNGQAAKICGLDRIGDARQVILVRDEESRDALAKETMRTVVSWGGRTQGVDRGELSPISGRNVVIWPAPGGWVDEIAAILIGIGATVRVMVTSDGSNMPSAAEAIREGWDKARLDAFMRETVRPWSLPKPPAPAAEKPAPVAGPTQAGPARKPTSASDLVEFRRRARSDGEAPILDPRDPMPSARALLADKFTASGLPTMHHYRGTFWRWNGSCYRDADKDNVQAEIWRYLDGAKRYGKQGEKIDFQPNRGEVENVAAAFRAVCNLPGHVEAPAWLEDQGDIPAAGEFLAVQNGLLHLASGDIYPPTPAYFCLNSTGIAYSADAPEPTEWLRFLNLIWPNDTKSIETLQDIFGCLLSTDTSHQKIPLIVGPKRSGKGTIARVLTALLGQASVTAPTLASLSTNFGLAPLIGKSVAIIGDARLSGKADQAAIAERLLSISGEDSITVDRKFESAWTGRLGVRFVIMSNELPRLSDASGALASRFIVLTMERSFYGHEDRGLGNRLLAELPGILNWAREGYLRLRKRGYFLQPDSARDAIEELEELGSPISAFIKARCVVSPGLKTPANDIFVAWREWCEANGRREAGTVQSFGRDLRAAVPGLRIARPRIEGSQVRCYEGIRLLSEGSPPSLRDW